MKIIFVTIICIFFISNLSCNTKNIISEQDEQGEYLITKIDSINNWYVIYAIKDKSKYKIISKKTNKKRCNEIAVGKSYNFILRSMYEIKRESAPIIDGVKLFPQNYLHLFPCFHVDDETDICIELANGIYDLYFCDNLKGLCLRKKSCSR